MSGNNDEEYNDFANQDEEIKEEIGSDNDDIIDQLQCTYDKFLMESVALNYNNGNSNQVQTMLRNQMKNIIGEIKQQKIENIKNNNNRKQQILKDLSEKFNLIEKKEEENTICNIETNEPTTLNETKQNRENTLIESLKESQDKLYNINIEEFIKDNTKVDINEDNHNNLILNQNETVDNPYVNHSNNNSFNTAPQNNISVHGNPYLQKRIQENYNRFLMNSQKNSNQVTGRFQANENVNKDQRLILVDSCTDEQERQIKQQKIERLRMKKLKELEEKNKNLRKKSKSKPTIHNNDNNISNSSKSRIAINARPSTANCTITSKNSVTKIRPNTSKANYSNITSNSSGMNDSNMSRVPIKIKRAECIIANKKVKNVKYSKMSNKNAIKKAIKEVCLAGPHYKDSREKILSIIDSCECENYIILFKGDYGFYLHGVYTFDSQNKQIELLTCINDAPNFIDSSMVEKYYRYNISQKQFKELGGNKEFSVIVDGIILRANI